MSALSPSAIIKLTYSVAYKITMKQDNVQKEDEIKKIYDIALKYAPNYDSEQIYAELNKD